MEFVKTSVGPTNVYAIQDTKWIQLGKTVLVRSSPCLCTLLSSCDALAETTHERLQGLGMWMLYTLGDSMVHPCLRGQKFM